MFQSLIGILQTRKIKKKESLYENVSIPHRYSTNRKILFFNFLEYLVSIPHRYSTNQEEEPEAVENEGCFNPS